MNKQRAMSYIEHFKPIVDEIENIGIEKFLLNGSLNTILGATGSGKTFAAIYLACYKAYELGENVLFCTHEDSTKYVFERLDIITTHFGYKRSTGSISIVEDPTIDTIRDTIYDYEGNNVLISSVIVDGVSLMRGNSEYNWNNMQENIANLSEIAKGEYFVDTYNVVITATQGNNPRLKQSDWLLDISDNVLNLN